MTTAHRSLALAPLLASAALGCAPPSVWAAQGGRETEESNALIMTAEIALQRDDCGRASADYSIAAQRLTDGKLAARAVDVALECGQFEVAERAATRWRALVPADPATLHATMRAQLGLYHIDDARSALEGWLKSVAARTRMPAMRRRTPC